MPCFRPTMFPPGDASSLHLENCVRVLPHQNNTGGFFVCCIRKVAELDLNKLFVSNKSNAKAKLGNKKRKRDKHASGEGSEVVNASSLIQSSIEQINGGKQQRVDAEVGLDANTVTSHRISDAVSVDDDASAAASKVELNPLLDFSEITGGSDCCEGAGDVSSVSAAEVQGDSFSVYQLAAAASKPGGLFHLLVPMACDPAGVREINLISDFYGLSDNIPLVSQMRQHTKPRAVVLYRLRCHSISS